MKSGYSGRGGAILASGLVLVVAGAFLVYGKELRKDPVQNSIVMHAQFNSANGLKPGADVDLAGVTVGRVQSIRLDPQSQMADVAFSVDERLHLPVDTAVGIGAPSMTSDNALQIEPGKDPKTLTNGGVIKDTRDQLSLEQQVSNYIFGGGNLGN
ncbi:toluene ABC transporter periplasmic protein [Gluconobacter frateurii NBRC 101659]|uniref:MlaD family protein n=1 Tax=Gluconobacter japonicus TaxID=376620 RepID=UPI00029A0FDB|nr:toluene ABC transporter periplasmic protein [Gluconobacter frateurii NBRC 101659]